MSESDNVADTDRRFEIFVPSPKARINLGARNRTSTGPFGYTGLSIQSDVHLFIDANKNTLYQTGQSYCGQVGGQWRQFSNDHMFLSSTANTVVTADNKLILASGAGQGQITALDHGTNMRLVPYNELKLHYVVDALETGLFEFFHGRHTRQKKSFGLLKSVDLEHFFSKKNRIVSLTAKASELINDSRDAHKGGFLNTIARSWEQLEGGVKEADLGDPEPGTVPALAPIIASGIAPNGDDVLEDMEYGFSKYMMRFDPYHYGKKDWLNKLHKVVSKLKRFVHVALKYGEVLTDLPIIKQAFQAMDAINSLMAASWGAYNMGRDSFPALIGFERASDGSFEAGKGGIVDEATSGWGARIGTVASGVAATDEKAKITSAAEPAGAEDVQGDEGWALASGTTYRLNISWKDGAQTNAVVVGRDSASATMTITAPTFTNSPENKTIGFKIGKTNRTVSLNPGNTGTPDAFKTALAAALSGVATVATATSGAKAGVTVQGLPLVSISGPGLSGGISTPSASQSWTPPARPAQSATPVDYTITVNGEAFTVSLGYAELESPSTCLTAITAVTGSALTGVVDGAAVELTAAPPATQLAKVNDTSSLLSRLGVGNSALTNQGDTLALSPPQLRVTGEQQELALNIDGTTIKVTLDASTNLKAQLDAVPQVAVLAYVSGSGNGPLTITSKSLGSASKVKATVADDTGWTFSASDDETGRDGQGPLLTLAELIALIPSLDGVSASSEDDKLVLEATAAGKGSKVEASGTLADLIFGSNDKKNEVTKSGTGEAEGFGGLEESYNTLISWNHELQKLPEDTRNLTRPLTNALQDTLSTVSALEGMLKTGAEIFEAGAPPPPEAIGLLAADGITLGTQDRIVGTGGKGIVFISDGGTGSVDRSKFVLSEGWVADISAWSSNIFSGQDDPAPARSLGFRVLSDSVVDLTSTVSASLAALGRAKAGAPRPDGRKDIGIGIARVLGSYASEIAGYEKVVVSARNPGKDGDKAGATGGRVEILGQRVVLGAVDDSVDCKNGVAQALTDRASLGTQSIRLANLAGAEHLEGGEDSDVDWLAEPLSQFAWSAALRDAHPQTSHVDIHATTQIETVVLPYRLNLTTEKARLGIVTPEETDRRTELSNEKKRLEAIKKGIEKRKSKFETMKMDAQLKRVDYVRKRANPLNALRFAEYDRKIERYETMISLLETGIEHATSDIAKATTAVDDAADALDNFSNTWDAKAFPLLEVSEEAIKLGFVAGDGTWEDFAYLEITKDGIKIFQPKSEGVPTFDSNAGNGVVSDGTKDATVTVSGGKIKLKYTEYDGNGVLKIDSSGNVKIG